MSQAQLSTSEMESNFKVNEPHKNQKLPSTLTRDIMFLYLKIKPEKR